MQTRKQKGEYINLKLDYAKKHSAGIKNYTDYKESFVKKGFLSSESDMKQENFYMGFSYFVI